MSRVSHPAYIIDCIGLNMGLFHSEDDGDDDKGNVIPVCITACVALDLSIHTRWDYGIS